MKHEINIRITAIQDDEYKIDFTQELQGQFTPEELAMRIAYVQKQIRELLLRATKESIDEALNKSKLN